MVGSDEDHARSRKLGAEDWRWSSTGQVLGGRTVERSSDAVCGLHHAQGDEEHGFLSLPSKLRLTVSRGLATKLVATVSLSLASKSLGTVSPSLASKLVAWGLPVWTSKPAATV
jgi:hypothetical protein